MEEDGWRERERTNDEEMKTLVVLEDAPMGRGRFGAASEGGEGNKYWAKQVRQVRPSGNLAYNIYNPAGLEQSTIGC